jgi:hypothetical protein
MRRTIQSLLPPSSRMCDPMMPPPHDASTKFGAAMDPSSEAEWGPLMLNFDPELKKPLYKKKKRIYIFVKMKF